MRPTDLKAYLACLTREDLLDVDFLADRFLPTLVDLRINQTRCDFAAFLGWIGRRAKFIHTYMEVGVEWGGSFYTIDQYLRKLNSKFTGSTAVDINRNAQEWDAYVAQNPGTTFQLGESQKVPVNGMYDLIFIDACHNYPEVRADYEKFRHYCRWLAFHDVLAFPDDVGRLWEEMKPKHQHWEMFNGKEDQWGIGVIHTALR